MTRLSRVPALVGIMIVLAFYAEVLTHAPVKGQDFRNFYAAATVLRHGGDPYNQRQLLRAEIHLYHPATATQYASLAGNPYVQGPPLAMAFMPVVGLPAAFVYRVYAIVLAAAAGIALAMLALLWPAPGTVQRIVVSLISPVTFLCVLLGQPDTVLLLALVLALWLLYHENCALAGLILAVGFIKPQIMAGPFVILAVLAWRRGRLDRYVVGMLAGLAAFIGGSLFVVGRGVVGGWVHELVGFSQTTVYTQVDIASLTTLWVGWAPHVWSVVLSAVCLATWIALCVILWRRTTGAGQDERWWLAVTLTLWLLATPYAHPHDDVLLLPAVWYLLGAAPNKGMARVVGTVAFITWWLLPMTSVLGLRPPVLRGLGIIPILGLAAILTLQHLQHSPVLRRQHTSKAILV